MRVLARIPTIGAAAPATGAAGPTAVAPVAAAPSPLADAPPAADAPPDAADAMPEAVDAPPDNAAQPSRRPLPRRPGRGESRARHRGPTFPFKSVVALGIVAAVAWSLASWSEQQRLARHRQERMARVTQAFSAQGTTR